MSAVLRSVVRRDTWTDWLTSWYMLSEYGVPLCGPAKLLPRHVQRLILYHFSNKKHRGYVLCFDMLVASFEYVHCLIRLFYSYPISSPPIPCGPGFKACERVSEQHKCTLSVADCPLSWTSKSIAFIISASCLIVWIRSVAVSKHFGRDSICSLWRYGACGLRSFPTCTGGELDEGMFILFCLDTR